MTKIQTQGVHHITFVGSNREAIIDFYQGVLGMPLVFEQPNLDQSAKHWQPASSGLQRLTRNVYSGSGAPEGAWD